MNPIVVFLIRIFCATALFCWFIPILADAQETYRAYVQIIFFGAFAACWVCQIPAKVDGIFPSVAQSGIFYFLHVPTYFYFNFAQFFMPNGIFEALFFPFSLQISWLSTTSKTRHENSGFLSPLMHRLWHLTTSLRNVAFWRKGENFVTNE